MTTRRIRDIIIGHCYRQDLGDIQALAESIREFGLLRPVLITRDAPRDRHSEKPGSKLELFARKKREGWVTHGLIEMPK